MLRLCTLAVVIVVASAQVKKPRESATSSSSSSGSSGSARRRPPTSSSSSSSGSSKDTNRKAATGASGGGGGGGLGMEVIIPIIIGVVAVMSGLAFFIFRRNAKSKDLLQQVAEEEERHKKEEAEKLQKREERERAELEQLQNQKKEAALAAKRQKVAATGGLPAGWEHMSDPSSGKIYYFNRSTGESAWTPPAPAPVTLQAVPEDHSLRETAPPVSLNEYDQVLEKVYKPQDSESGSTVTPVDLGSRQATEDVPDVTAIQDNTNTAAFVMSAPPVDPASFVEATPYEGGGPVLDKSTRENCTCICNAV